MATFCAFALLISKYTGQRFSWETKTPGKLEKSYLSELLSIPDRPFREALISKELIYMKMLIILPAFKVKKIKVTAERL